jgi:hypothetical protein
MCYFDVILLSDVISSIGPKISDTDTYMRINFQAILTLGDKVLPQTKKCDAAITGKQSDP